MNWLQELDRELYTLRCKENLVYYLQDIGKDFDREQLHRISETRRELLNQPNLMNKVKNAKRHREYIVRRKAELLEKTIINTKIEYDPILLEIKNEITEKQHQFDFSSIWEILCTSSSRSIRKEAYLSQLSYLNLIEKSFKQFVARANGISQTLGFSDYMDAKFYIEETNFKEISGLISYAITETEKNWKEFVIDAKTHIDNTLEPYDLDYLIEQRLGRLGNKQFKKEEILYALIETLSSFEVKYSELPISIDTHDLPYVGACYPLKVGEDIRLVLNPSEGYTYCELFFHEFGHAIYYSFAPSESELMIDNQIMREVIADMWKRMVGTREWLEKFSPFSQIEIDNLLRSYGLRKTLWIRPLIRDYLFEVEIFRNEKQKFSDIWNKVTNAILLIPDSTGVYSDWDFSHPLDIKNYVLSAFASDRCINFIRREFSSVIGRKDIFDFLVENFYKPGNRIPFNEKLKSYGGNLW